MVVYKWKIWCITEQEWKYVWSPEQPTVCPSNETHQIEPIKTTNIGSVGEEDEDVIPKGVGFKLRSPCITCMTEPFIAAPLPGKKFLIRVSRCTFNSQILDFKPIVFEFYRKLDLGLPGDPQHYIIYQEYYRQLSELLVDSDEVEVADGDVFVFNFNWPTLTNRERVPTIVSSKYEDFLKVYLTEDEMHQGYGKGAPNLLWEPVPGVRAYNPYNLATNLPSWSDDLPMSKRMAQVCFHCISYDVDQMLPGID